MGCIGILTNILAVCSSSHTVDVKTGCAVLETLKTICGLTNPLGIFGSGVGILTQIFAVGGTSHAINVQTGCTVLNTTILCTTASITTSIAAGAASSVPNSNVGITLDRKSTRLNSSHVRISYAVFCLKKKKKNNDLYTYYYS